MLPVLFRLGPITVYSYGVLLASAYLLALYYAVHRARRFGLDANRVLDLGIYIIISALVGAKLLLLIVDFDYFRRQPAELWTLQLDALAVARVALPDDFVDEAPIGGEIVEGARAAQQERVPDRSFQMTMRALDCAILMSDAGIIA